MKQPKTAIQQLETSCLGNWREEKDKFLSDKTLFVRKFKYLDSDKWWVWFTPKAINHREVICMSTT